MSTFKTRKQQETVVGRKRAKATVIEDAERRQCAKVVVPDTQGITALVEGYKEKCRDEEGIDQWTMWHLQLKMAKEMVLIAAKVLRFLEQVADLEELYMDAETDMAPLIDEMICECQDAILEATPEEPLELWTRNAERDKKTDTLLDQAIATMNKVVGMVFRDKKWIKTEERYDLLHASCALFQASEDLVKSATGDGEHIFLEERLEYMFDDAIGKCDDQTLDEYLDVDRDNEEEDEDDEQDEDEEEEQDEDD